MKAFIDLFKVRIGVAIAFAAAAGLAVEQGTGLGFLHKAILVLAVLGCCFTADPLGGWRGPAE